MMISTRILALFFLSMSLTRADVFFTETVLPVLHEYCFDCHDPDDPDGDVIFLDARTPDDLSKHRGTWHSVAEQLRNRTMPPAKSKAQPGEDERMRVSDWIRYQLRESAVQSGPFAGWVKARRLNRLEYDRTVRDLVGVSLNFSETFPLEGGGGEGFDNNSETLFLPPLLLERFMEAAQAIVDAAIVSPPLARRFGAEDLLPRLGEEDPEFRLIVPGRETSVLIPVQVDGVFKLDLRASALDGSPGFLVVRVDGIKVARSDFGDSAKDGSGPISRKLELRLTRGLHAVSFHAEKASRIRLLEVGIEEQPGLPNPARAAVHEALLGFAPGEMPRGDAKGVAEKILSGFVERAFRRPLREGEVGRYVRLFERAAARGDAFEDGMKLAMKGVLVSPDFLFRLERPPVTRDIEALEDFEMASRLSYFLWATMPDEELWRLGKAGKLRDVEIVDRQIDRMLKDPRSLTFSKAFVGQWLGTKDVGGRVAPTENSIQHYYTPEVATAMRDEVVLFFHNLIRDDRSVLELIDSDYSHMSGRLAKFYERSDWEEFERDKFRRVSLTEGRRGGLLGMGAVMALTSHHKQTSPILRGAWILDTLFGTPVPPPPPNVPPAPKKAKDGRKLTTREMLARHRAEASCAACHNLIDPIGFGLENFDFLGRWREKDAGEVIDARGRLPSGEEFSGPGELKAVLLQRKDVFVRHLTRKVLGYALGRSLSDADEGTIETIARELEANGFGARRLIREVVFSTPFRNKQLVGE